MPTPEQIIAYWPILLSIFAAYGFILGLHWKVKNIQKELDTHKTDYLEQQKAFWAKFDLFQHTISSVQQSVAKIEGMLGGKNSS